MEMPLFAFAHMFAFSYTDFIDRNHMYVARMPMYYAFRDAFGLLDVMEDSKATLRGEGMDYREFEPSEGYMHQGAGRDRRIRAGLRYSKGGKRKYWLPKASADTQPPGRVERGVNRVITRVAGRDQGEGVHAPLLAGQEEDVVHLAPDLQENEDEEPNIWGEAAGDGGYDLPFGDLDDMDEELFAHSKQYLFGDYNYPVIDVSSEDARTVIWDEEERVLRDERGAWFSPIRGSKGQAAMGQRDGPAWEGYGAVGTTTPRTQNAKSGALFDAEDHEPGKVIDYEQDRTPAVDTADVRLRWTKDDRRPSSRPASSSFSQSPHVRNRPGLREDYPSGPSSAESSSSAANRARMSPPSMSRTNSRGSTSSVLPPDAVDLVVEDHSSSKDDRKRGDPVSKGSGLRNVYRQGFVTHDSQGRRTEGEVEVDDSDTRGSAARMDIGEKVLVAVGDEGEDAPTSSRTQPSTDIETEVVARAETPPLHARGYNALDHDNPWA